MRKTILIIIASIMLLGGCQKTQPKTEEQNTATAVVVAVPVVTAKARFSSISDWRTYGGEVVCSETMNIIPENSGKIVSLSIKEGDYVEKNQVIAELDQSKPGLNYQPYLVKAPMNGTVGSLTAHVEGYASPSLSMGTILGTDQLEITFRVPERQIGDVRKGAKVVLSFDAYGDETFKGSITDLAPSLDTVTRTRKATCTLDQNDGRIIPGMYARVKVLVTNKQSVIAIPSEANNSGSVFVVDHAGETSSVRKVAITTGIEEDGMLEVVSGLEGGEELVTKGQNQLSDGSIVSVIKGEAR